MSGVFSCRQGRRRQGAAGWQEGLPHGRAAAVLWVCFGVSFVLVTLVCGAAALEPLPGTEEAGGRCPQILPDSGCLLTVIVCRWYKQVVQGDCDTPQPGVWNIEARAKWNGWNKMKGLAADDCRVRYLDQLSAKVPKDWINWPQLDKLKAELVCLPTPPFPPSPSDLPRRLLLQGLFLRASAQGGGRPRNR